MKSVWKVNVCFKHVCAMLFISLDFAVVIDTPRESLLRYNWQPAVLSTEIVGADPYREC